MPDENNSFQGASLTTDDGAPNPLLKAAVESANDAIIITEVGLEEPGPRIEYVNPAFTRMTGYEAADVLGRSPRLLQGPRTDRGLLARLRDDLRNGRSFHGETINYRKDGTEYHVEWRITPLFGDDGRVAKWVAIQRDVSERVRADREREQSLERERSARTEAEQAGRMKDEFLATLSHELRTPLNAIVGWTQILKMDRGLSGDAAEGLAVIERNARAQTQIIEDILDMSRIIAGKLRLDVQPVDLAALVRAGADTVRPAADAKGVRLEVVVDPAAGPARGDPGRLQQVFWNLLSNAVKFTSRGGRVQVLLERVNSQVEASFADTGEGIDPAFLPFVFDRFRQADGSTTRKHGGLGLGLSIVKQLVELHGGSVRVRSPGKGEGSTFVVAMPLAVVHADAAGPEPARDHPPAAATADEYGAACDQLRGVSVVVVDDEPDGRALVRRLLADCGATVRTAGSAAEAVALLAEAVPGVLVSDVGMPGEDGYALLRRVRAMTPARGGRVPAVALTAYARAADRVRAMEAGFQTHLAKPVEPTELVVTVAALARMGGQPAG